MRRARFYKDLWQQAEADRRAADEARAEADKALLAMASHMRGLTALLENDPNPLVRGEARRLRSNLGAS